jgi:membrane protein involved in colicin uptake
MENIGDLAEVLPFEKIFDSRYLNQTYKLATAQKEIVDKIDTVKTDLETIDSLDSKYKLNAKDVYIKTLDLSKDPGREQEGWQTWKQKLEADKRRKAEEEAERKRQEEIRKQKEAEEQAKREAEEAERKAAEAKKAQEAAAEVEQTEPQSEIGKVIGSIERSAIFPGNS